MYRPQEIEPKWQRRWQKEDTYRIEEDSTKPKYYVLGMFPYPSGSGLHVGHPLGYTAVDIVARYKRMRGFNVLNPMGWDAFGLPAERAAVREGRHPAEITQENIAYFKEQLMRLGFSYDWSREVSTSSEDYYRWTQWIFLKLYEKGLAYLAEVPVNWCPAQGTVLANEEVVDGKYVETGDVVERKMMKQWMLKITAYAQRLLDDLDDLDWPEGVLEMQRKWIGRSEGAEVQFEIQGTSDAFTVYTTRPDTLFGATYCVLSPEHSLVESLVTDAQRSVVSSYVAAAKNRSDLDRQADKEKTGVFTGAYAINPVNSKAIPIWISDYVLMSYGSGAIMAVPAHDERDFEFAKKFKIDIVPVVSPPSGHDLSKEAYTGDGLAINSGPYNGLTVSEFKTKIIAWLEEHGIGCRKVNYKLRDWLFSRQRYWGEPFPIVYDEEGGHHPVHTDELPVRLPHLTEYKPTADGEPPLARAKAWLSYDKNGKSYVRETNTMPQWAGSCWYYLRYMDASNDQEPFSSKAVGYWQNVDLYIGGVEHAVLHLLYARFWHKVLYDCGIVPTKEPFQRLFNQGMILASSYRDARGKYHHPDDVELNGPSPVLKSTGESIETQVEKMSKSKKNTVDPLDIVEEFGADTLRIYEMFMGPLEQVKPWQTNGCKGVRSFLSRVYRMLVDEFGVFRESGPADRQLTKALHIAIKEATDGIESLKFNTPVSKMMEFVNAAKGRCPERSVCEDFLKILSPYAPHLASELWDLMGNQTDLSQEPWPQFNPDALIEDTKLIVIQIMGKVRSKISVPAGSDKETVLALAKADPKIASRLEGKQLIKEIYVPNKIVNFVAR